MRKPLTAVFVALLSVVIAGSALVGCSEDAAGSPSGPSAPDAPMAPTTPSAPDDPAAPDAPPNPDAALPAPETQTHEAKEMYFGENGTREEELIDLSGLSNLMAYAEVYNMVIEPQGYLGKPVKLKGTYFAEYYGFTQRYHHYIVVEDEAACCKQGLEFMWEGDPVYPDDFPANGSPIELTGVFGQYEEQGSQVGCLAIEGITTL